VPLLVTPGNHDGSAYPRFELERSIFAEQWQANKPQVEFVEDAHYPFHYAFAWQDTLFVSLDATRPGALSEDQKNWLNDLFTGAGRRYPRKVVFSHLPLWPFSQQRETEALFDRELEHMLQEHKVDLYLSGHHHAYYPGYKDGMRYLSQACLGAGARPLIGDKRRSRRSITLVNFSDDNSIEVEALAAPEFIAKIPLHSLPEKITTPQATLVREDLVRHHTGVVKP
jgi:3',5'-cyclic AMP phosphodiesterase CpdA